MPDKRRLAFKMSTPSSETAGKGPNTGRYAAFISYSHHDKKWAIWLQRELERYRFPTGFSINGRLLPPAPFRRVFRDETDSGAVPDLTQHIRDALSSSERLIVICSPAAVASPWVDLETKAFKAKRGAGAVFCLIVGGTPGGLVEAGQAASECFPLAVRFKVDSSGLPSAEPETERLAADFRWNRVRRSDSLWYSLWRIVSLADFRERCALHRDGLLR
ncbi:MAG TPA: hypothetical protein DCE44_19785, partial [Verrucomicrobiales bacterium]|nr:hypothetical protein [Verrucomicrobiales bacterium]